MRRACILDWVRMRRSHDRYNDVEPSSPPQSSPDYTIVIRGYNFREGHPRDPWRTASPLCPSLSFRYTQPTAVHALGTTASEAKLPRCLPLSATAIGDLRAQTYR